MYDIRHLLTHLELKKQSENLFLGENESVGSKTVFGGQVLAQALHAACAKVDNERIPHSLHAYFLLPGDLSLPIQYETQVMRIGGSFSTVRVSAIQKNEVIFILACSFQLKQAGYEHQLPMPENIPSPEGLMSWADIFEKFGPMLPDGLKKFLALERPFTFKPTVINNPLENKNLPPYTYVWVKPKNPPAQISLQQRLQCLLYVSDYNILSTALQPHASVAHFGNTQMASLDHAVWFHRDFDVNDWLLFCIETPFAGGARGFSTGRFYQNGNLIASVVQEGLIRPMRQKD